MKKILTVLLALAVMTTSAGCDFIDTAVNKIKEAFPAAEETDASENAQQAENVSNCINVGIVGFDTFNPLTTDSQTVREAMQFVYEPLFTVDENLRPEPVLAEDYSLSPDGRKITINLKQGVKWHDGADFNAYDAAYTFKSIRNGYTTYTDNLANIADYRILDDYQLEITLRAPILNFVSLLTFPIVKYQTAMNKSSVYTPIGTGPFKFDGKLSTDKMQFSANEEYRDGRPAADKAFIVFIPDEEKYRSMFEASEIDVITSSMVDLTKYMPKGGVTINKFNSNKLIYLGYNLNSPKLSGTETRIGLSEFINKEDIVSSAIYSHGTATDVSINPSSYLYCTNRTVFTADEISAAEHLKNDKWELNPDGIFSRADGSKTQTLTLKILVNSDDDKQMRIAEKIQEYFSKFGVNVTKDAQPYDKYEAKINARDFELLIGEAAIQNDMDLSPLINSYTNCFAYRNGDVDTLLSQLGMTSGEEEQKLLMSQLAGILMQDMPFVPLYFKEDCVLSSSKIKSGLSPSVGTFYRNCAAWNRNDGE